MTFTRLLLENLFFHRRGNLAVLLGVVVGTAVLAGALLVGDSLRGSLRELTEKQLGWVDVALVSQHFFREEVAQSLGAPHAAGVLLMQAAASVREGDRPVPKTLLLGVGPDFWTGGANADATLGDMPADFWSQQEIYEADKTGVVLSAALASDLSVGVGDKVSFALERTGAAPRETLLGYRSAADVVSTFVFQVKAVLPPDHFGSHFTLNPNPAPPRNAFVPLGVLQDEWHDQQRQKKLQRRFPRRPINAIFADGTEPRALQSILAPQLDLKDWGLELVRPVFKLGMAPPKYLSLQSRAMFIPPAVHEAAKKAKLRFAPTLVYLVNNMARLKHQWGALGLLLAPLGGAEITRPFLHEFAPVQVPYFIVAALDPGMAPPLGRFLPEGMPRLADDEILLVQWEDSPFAELVAGEAYIALTYFDPDQQGRLEEKSALFRIAGQIPIKGAARDMYLTPEFPGITDSGSLTRLDGWDPPFPFKRWLVSDADEEYWNTYRTIPKAYITRAAGQKLWGSRFGDVTSLRIDPQGRSKDEIEKQILAELDPTQGGFVFEDVRAAGLQASAGSQEFGGLFLGFSFFLIVAALLLIGLLFRLNLDRRASEIGLLLAVGHRRRTVRRLLLAEGGLLALVGGALGLLVAVVYAQLLLDYLAASWPGGLDRGLFLRLHVTPQSLLIGYVAAVLISVGTIFWATRVLGRVSPKALLAGATSETEGLAQERSGWISKMLVVVGLAGAAVCFVLGTRTREHELQAGSFMGSGALLLTAGLAAVWIWLHRPEGRAVTKGGALGLARLGMRNAARSPVRSLLTLGLLASATFLVIAVQAFHRDPSQDFLETDGGSGGFALLAESQVPIFEDLNAKAGLDRFAESEQVKKLLREARFYPLRLKQGDDASCLNLYKPKDPRLLGLPQSVIERGGFHFGNTEAARPEEEENPWLLLNRTLDDGAIPVIGENNTVTWMLGSKLGGEITVTDGAGQPVRLRIVGLLRDSAFQSELLMSEANFQKLYPRLEGFQFFLVEGPNTHLTEVKKALEKSLAEYGVVVTPSRERLETYLAVENTYLATFQALGGLGLLLGALGLAVVLLRAVYERRGELALLRALGFRRSALSWMVLAENAYLLILGLGVGTVAALLSVAPHVAAGSEVRWLPLVGLLLLVLLVGLLAGLLAVAATLRAPILMALRKE